MADSGLIALLRGNRQFRWFSIGLFTSRVGDVFNGIALAWLALSVAGPRELGMVLLLAGLPRVPFSPFAGHLLDRFDARTLLIIDNVARGLVVAVVPALSWTGQLHIWHLYAVAATTGILSTLTDVGENLVVPALVADRHLESANALVSVTWEGSALLGPALAGVLVDTVGVEIAFVIDAATFLTMAFSAFLLPSLRRPRTPDQKTESTFSQLAIGFRQLVRLRAVGILTIVSLVFLTLSGMAEVGFPSYSRYDVGTDAAGFGLLMAVAGLGAVLGVLLLTPRLSALRPRTALGVVLVLHGLLFVPLGLTRSLVLAMVSVLVLYFVVSPFYALERTLVQRAIPAELRGRVFGARRTLTAAGYPAGAALGGLLVSSLGAPGLFYMTAGVLVVLAAMVWVTPSLRSAAPSTDSVTTTGSADRPEPAA